MQDGTIEDKVVNPQMLINLGDLYYSLRVDYLDDNYCMFRAYQYTQGDYKSINYCTHFPIVNSNPNPPYNCIRLVDVDEYGINILIEKNIASTQAELRTWLQNNNVQAQVTLGEPDETPFTSEQQPVIDEIIKDGTYKEVTHYTSEASLNPDMEIGYYKDLEIWVNNLINS